MVVGLIVEEISNVDTKYVKVTGAQNTGQGHRVKVPAKSVHLEEALCKVWYLIVEKIWNVNVNCVKVSGAQNIGQSHWVNISAKSGGQGDVSCKELWLL